jgi:phage tail sheath protein FI
MQGVTAANPALFPTRTPIKRRRMADLIEDTLAQIASAYIKLPATTERIDAFVSECDAFLATLKSTDLPAFQRIVDYSLDEKSGNTKDNQALGIFVLKVFVRTLPSLDFPVFIAKIGETVTIPVTTQAAA